MLDMVHRNTLRRVRKSAGSRSISLVISKTSPAERDCSGAREPDSSVSLYISVPPIERSGSGSQACTDQVTN
jgi:hypothetical protein